MEDIYFRDIKSLPKFDSAKGLDVEYHTDGKIYIPIKKIPRKVTLKITTWRIISNGIHYYGKLIVDDLCFKEKDIKTKSVFSSTGAPEETKGFNLILRHELSEEEYKKDPKRYEYLDIGEMTGGFSTKVEIKNLAEKIFNEKFGDGWKLFIDDQSKGL